MPNTLEAKARELGLHGLTLHSQTYAVPLYAKHGYQVVSGTCREAGIEHVTMSRVL